VFYIPDKNWKKAERRIAAKFGSTRTPLSGSNSKVTASDTFHEKLYIEVKRLKRVPGLTLFEDTVAKAKIEKKVPVVAFTGHRMRGALVMCQLTDLPRIAAAYRGSESQRKALNTPSA
jgi:hypothetical protein